MIARVAPLIALLVSACGSASPSAGVQTAVRPPSDGDRARTFAFVRAEDDAIDWLAVADPRLAARADDTPPETVLRRVGLDAVLAEDTGADIRGGSINLFAFQARLRALDQAANAIAAVREPLPDAGPVGTPVARPRLERELLERLIQEERTRAADEAALGDASADLVRAIVSTWKPPQAPQEWLDRDIWVGKRLLEIRASLKDGRPRTAPSDLDMALYPLERLLAPTQFPRGSAGIAEVRMALDEDMRAVPSVDSPDRLERAIKVHFGLTINPALLRSRLERIEERLREVAERAVAASADPRAEIESRAHDLLLIERSCPAVADSRVRSMAPPPRAGGDLRGSARADRRAVFGGSRRRSARRRPSVLRRRHRDLAAAKSAAFAPGRRRYRGLASQGARATASRCGRRAGCRDCLRRGGRRPETPGLACARRGSARHRRARSRGPPVDRRAYFFLGGSDFFEAASPAPASAGDSYFDLSESAHSET